MSNNPLWNHPRKAMLIAKLDQDSEGVVGELLRRAAELDDLDEHEAAAAYCYDLVSDPAQNMVGLAAGVAILAIRMHRSSSR